MLAHAISAEPIKVVILLQYHGHLPAYHLLHFKVTTNFSNHPVNGASAKSELQLFNNWALKRNKCRLSRHGGHSFFVTSEH